MRRKKLIPLIKGGMVDKMFANPEWIRQYAGAATSSLLWCEQKKQEWEND